MYKKMLLLPLCFILVACNDEEKPAELEITKETIVNIEPAYEGGFLGRGSYFIVETEVQTYVVSDTTLTSPILNNNAEESKLILIEDKVSNERLIELTGADYKKLSSEYSKVTSYTLDHENITLDKYIEVEY